MLDYNSIKHNQERHKDFVREAEQDRLVRKAAGSATARGERWMALAESLRCHFAHFRFNLMNRAGLRREPALC